MLLQELVEWNQILKLDIVGVELLVEYLRFIRFEQTVIFDQQYLKISMDSFFTPVKQTNPANAKLTKTTAQTREGDWICLHCNNLNFSFRKKCNRCKTQTRQQNEDTFYSYMYYSKNYLFMPEQPHDNHHSHATTSVGSAQPENNSIPVTPKQNRENVTPQKVNKELPSVSPLIKKYKSRDVMKSSQSQNSSDSGSVWGEVRDFQQTLGTATRGQQQSEQQESEWELQRMIGNIML